MWIALPDAFVSIVHQPEWCAPDEVVVRARRLDHLETFLTIASGTVGAGQVADVIATDDADYPYRANVNRGWVAALLTEFVIHDLDYPNFKNRVQDRRYHDALLSTWAAMRRIEEPRPDDAAYCLWCGDPIVRRDRDYRWVDANGLESCAPHADRHEPEQEPA